MRFSTATISNSGITLLMCNLIGVWNLNHYQNVATVVTGLAYWSARHAKPSRSGWDGILQKRTSVSSYLPN